MASRAASKECILCSNSTAPRVRSSNRSTRQMKLTSESSNAAHVEKYLLSKYSWLGDTIGNSWSLEVCPSCYLEVSRNSTKGVAIPPPRSIVTNKSLEDLLSGFRRRYDENAIKDLYHLIRKTSNHLIDTLPDVEGTGTPVLLPYIQNFVHFIKNSKSAYADWFIKWIIPMHLAWTLDDDDPIPENLKRVTTFAQLAKMLVPAIIDRFSNDSIKRAEEARMDGDSSAYNKEGYDRVDLTEAVPFEICLLSGRLVDILLQGLCRKNSDISDEESDLEQILNALLVCINGFDRLQGNLVGTLAIFHARPWAFECLLQHALGSTPSLRSTCCKILEILREAMQVFRLDIMLEPATYTTSKLLTWMSEKITYLDHNRLIAIELVLPLLSVVYNLCPQSRSPEMVAFVTECLNYVYVCLPFDLCFPQKVVGKPFMLSDIESSAPNTIVVKTRRLCESFCSTHSNVSHEPACDEALCRIVERLAELESIHQRKIEDFLHPTNPPKLGERPFFDDPNDFYKAIEKIEKRQFIRGWVPEYSPLVSSWRSKTLIDLETSSMPASEIITNLSVSDLDSLVNNLIHEYTLPKSRTLPEDIYMVTSENLERTLRSFPVVDTSHRLFIPTASEHDPVKKLASPKTRDFYEYWEEPVDGYTPRDKGKGREKDRDKDKDKGKDRDKGKGKVKWGSETEMGAGTSSRRSDEEVRPEEGTGETDSRLEPRLPKFVSKLRSWFG